MLSLDVAQVLSERLACDRCGATGRWVRVARPSVRENSSIHRLRCVQCGNQIAAKVSDGHAADADGRAALQHEYATLLALKSAFPQDADYGTLEPLACLDVADHIIMVTRWFPGTDLVEHLHAREATGVDAVLQRAGVWLRRLHGADGRPAPPRALGVGEKIEDLMRTYGAVLTARGTTRAACDLVKQVGAEICTSTVRPARLHGDFKPQNLLCDGARQVGLDMQWTTTAAPVYDLAPFLNHLWLAGPGAYGGRIKGRYARAENAFLAGYADAIDRRALRWAELYFALCHAGRYRLRGVLAARYAGWRITPLVKRIASQLRAST